MFAMGTQRDGGEWLLVKSVFRQALERPRDSRRDWILKRVDLPESVREELMRLLGHALSENPLSTALVRRASSAAPQGRELSPGQTVGGRFQIHGLLGRGGMGNVYRARDLETRQWVALKTVRPEIASDPLMLERLKAELAAARKIRHECVCQIYEFHRSSSDDFEGAFLTMELFEGETLFERLRRNGPLALEMADAIARQIAAGLEAIHRAGVLHRDLKPSNVFLSEAQTLRVVIADFGLAHDTTAPITETLAGFGETAVVGTPAYMAPEQLRGIGCTVQSDIHAFGAVLFEMVTGQLPFPGATPLAAALRRLDGEAPPLQSIAPHVPRRWRDAVAACLQSSPALRPRSAAEAIRILEGHRWPTSRRRAVGVMVGAGLALAGGPALWTLAPRRHVPPPAAEYHYKLGLEFARRRSPEDIRSAIAEFSEAVRLDKNFAAAWAELADVYCSAGSYSVMPGRDARRNAAECAKHALALDGSLGKAHAAVAYALSAEPRQWRSAEASFQRALEYGDPDGSIRARYANWLGRSGRSAEAVAMAEGAVQAAPGSFPISYQLAAELFRARDWRRLKDLMAQLVRIHPAEANAHLTLARANEWLRDFDAAEKSLAEAARLPNNDNLDSFRATLSAAEGRTDEVRAIADSNWKKYLPGGVETNVAATVQAVARNRVRLYEAIWKGLERDEDNVLAVPTNPYMDPYRPDAEFVSFVQRLGLV